MKVLTMLLTSAVVNKGIDSTCLYPSKLKLEGKILGGYGKT
jgi:hypothetical protein